MLFRSALNYYKRTLEIHRKIGDVEAEGRALGNLGNIHNTSGQYEEAIAYYKQALVISREIGNVRDEGVVLGNLGIAYKNLKQHAKAIEYLEKSRVIFEDRLRINFPFKTDLDRLNKKPRD